MNDQNLRHHEGVKKNKRGSKFPLQLRMGTEVSKIQQYDIKYIQQRAGQNILEPWKNLYTYLATGFPFRYLRRTCCKTLSLD